MVKVWDKETALEENPAIRCNIMGCLVDGSLVRNGRNVWVVAVLEGHTYETSVSWGLALQVLNDPKASPIYME